MSTAVESTHRSHFSPMLDSIARPGSGWSRDPYASRRTGCFSIASPQDYHTQQPQHQQQQDQQQQRSPPLPLPQQQLYGQGDQLLGPSSLFSSHSSSSTGSGLSQGQAPLPGQKSQQPQLPPSPGRDSHYSINIVGGISHGGNGNSNSSMAPRSAYYGGDYATPPPVTRTPPLMATPTGEQPLHLLVPKRRPDLRSDVRPDARLSPPLPSTSERLDEPFNGFRGHANQAHSHNNHNYTAFGQYLLSTKGPYHSMQQPVRSMPHQEDSRQNPPAGGMMGKLVPQSYSANGRTPRPAATPMASMAPTNPPVPPPLASHQLPQVATHQPPTLNSRSQAHNLKQGLPHLPASPTVNDHSHSQHQYQQKSSMSPTSRPATETKQMSINNLLSCSSDEPCLAEAATTAAPNVVDGRERVFAVGAAPPLPPPGPASIASSSSSPASYKAPPLMTPSPTLSTSTEYRIRVRQQPVAARSCGFGERDRRVIDPPPIVQLFVESNENSNGGGEEGAAAARIRHPFSVVHCSIWNETGEQDNSAMPEDYRQQRRLMGTLVASPFVGQDENGEEGCFFCFPDLSCRTPGSFRLKFSLVLINPLQMKPGVKSPIIATAMSDVFTVYNAKDFPGMQASTLLTKRLKEQGCLISIKKGNDKSGGGGAGGGGGGGGGAGGSHGRDDSDDDDEDAPAVSRRKKSRKS